MRQTKALLSILIFFIGCSFQHNSNVEVVAHRGDWRGAPENSLMAIQNCIEMGLDVVEIDVRLTKDSILVLMHDETVDRTTTLSGIVSSLTFSEIEKSRLKDGLGIAGPYIVPDLASALDLAKNRIVINLDKTYTHINLIYPMLVERNMLNQIIFKGWMISCDQFFNDIDFDPHAIRFMPILDLRNDEWKRVLSSYKGCYQPDGFEVIFDQESQLLQAVPLINELDGKIWVNTMWPWMCAGHDDESALNNPQEAYGWLIKQGVDMIQTDRPKQLADFKKQLN